MLQRSPPGRGGSAAAMPPERSRSSVVFVVFAPSDFPPDLCARQRPRAFLAPRKLRYFGAAVPAEHISECDHQCDADRRDRDLCGEAVVDLDEEEMPREGQHDARAEDIERLLAAPDGQAR